MASAEAEGKPATLALDSYEDVTGRDDESYSSLEPEEIWGELIVATEGVKDAPKGFKFTLQGPVERRFIVGRETSSDIRVDDPYVSSKHCVIFRDDNGIVYVEDHSRSGTFVNGELVQKSTRKRLANGDSLCLLRPPVHHHHSSVPTPGGSKKKTPTKAASPPPHYHEFIFRSHEIKVGPCRGEINAKYEVMDIIGSGSFATVRRGVNRHTGEEVAVKIVERKNFTFEPERWKDQLKEIDMLKRLNHSACVRMLDTYSTEDALYIVMEFIKGGELFDRIVKGGKLSEPSAQTLVKRLLQAVAYLHGEGIVHRDLKPENILLLHKAENCLHIKVADFGVARLVGGGCKTLTGSLSYIAPEVLERRDTIEGSGTYDYACDLWSVGVIAYVCLMARLPFKTSAEDENVVQNLKKAVKHLLEFKGADWKEVSDSAKDFITNVFCIDTKQRLTAKQALEHPWIKGAAQDARGETCSPPTVHEETSEDDVIADEKAEEHDDISPSIEDGTNAEGNRKRKKVDAPPVPLFSQET